MLTIVLSFIIAIMLALYVAENRRSARRLAESERRREETARELSDALAAKARLEERVVQLDREQTRRSAETEERFKAMATGIMLKTATAMQQQNAVGLSAALEPVKENFEQFRRTFADRTERDTAERLALGERVRELMELNSVIGRETRRLTDALKGNSKMQGDWGEMILESILERCGLQRGREFTVQTGIEDDNGRRLRPDVVINYTDSRKIIVDSKVSIQAYLGMLDARDDERRRSLGREHVASVRKHIAELKGKNYQDFVDGAKVDFVLMFIPHEGAYLAAMQLEPDLWQTAYDAHVLIVSPTHLMAVVRLVEQMWRQDRQNRNAQEIARQAGLMLDKFRTFLEDMDRIDKALNNGRDAWNDAFAKLSTGTGNLVSRAARLGELGAKARKDLPPRYRPEPEPDSPASED